MRGKSMKSMPRHVKIKFLKNQREEKSLETVPPPPKKKKKVHITYGKTLNLVAADYLPLCFNNK